MPYEIDSDTTLCTSPDNDQVAEALIDPLVELCDGSVDGVLCETMFKAVPLLVEIVRISERGKGHEERTDIEMINAAIDMLNGSSMTPEGCYFGRHKSDSTKLGCWPMKRKYFCADCESESVYWEATIYWDSEANAFEVGGDSSHDSKDGICGDCGAENVKWGYV